MFLRGSVIISHPPRNPDHLVRDPLPEGVGPLEAVGLPGQAGEALAVPELLVQDMLQPVASQEAVVLFAPLTHHSFKDFKQFAQTHPILKCMVQFNIFVEAFQPHVMANMPRVGMFKPESHFVTKLRKPKFYNPQKAKTKKNRAKSFLVITT